MAETPAIGVLLPLAPGQITSGDFLREWVAVVEECEIESVWGVEHVVLAHEYDPDVPMAETPAQRAAYDLAESDGIVHLNELGDTVSVRVV